MAGIAGALMDTDQMVRQAAVETLGGKKADVQTTLSNLVNQLSIDPQNGLPRESDADVRIAIVKALGVAGGLSVVAVLENTAKSDPVEKVRWAAERTLISVLVAIGVGKKDNSFFDVRTRFKGNAAAEFVLKQEIVKVKKDMFRADHFFLGVSGAPRRILNFGLRLLPWVTTFGPFAAWFFTTAMFHVDFNIIGMTQLFAGGLAWLILGIIITRLLLKDVVTPGLVLGINFIFGAFLAPYAWARRTLREAGQETDSSWRQGLKYGVIGSTVVWAPVAYIVGLDQRAGWVVLFGLVLVSAVLMPLVVWLPRVKRKAISGADGTIQGTLLQEYVQLGKGKPGAKIKTWVNTIRLPSVLRRWIQSLAVLGLLAMVTLGGVFGYRQFLPSPNPPAAVTAPAPAPSAAPAPVQPAAPVPAAGQAQAPAPAPAAAPVRAVTLTQEGGRWAWKADGQTILMRQGVAYQPTEGNNHIFNAYISPHRLDYLYAQLLPDDEAKKIDPSFNGRSHIDDLKRMGITAIRIYQAPVENEREIRNFKQVMDRVHALYPEFQVYVSDFYGLYEPAHAGNIEWMKKRAHAYVSLYGDRPWLAAFGVGNENDRYTQKGDAHKPLIKRSYGDYYSMMDQIAGAMKAEMAAKGWTRPVFLGNGYFHPEEAAGLRALTNFDGVAFNLYTSPDGLGDVVSRFDALNQGRGKPLAMYVGEFGELGPALARMGPGQRAADLDVRTQVLDSKAIAGHAVFEFSNEPSKVMDEGPGADRYGVVGDDAVGQVLAAHRETPTNSSPWTQGARRSLALPLQVALYPARLLQELAHAAAAILTGAQDVKLDLLNRQPSMSHRGGNERAIAVAGPVANILAALALLMLMPHSLALPLAMLANGLIVTNLIEGIASLIPYEVNGRKSDALQVQEAMAESRALNLNRDIERYRALWAERLPLAAAAGALGSYAVYLANPVAGVVFAALTVMALSAMARILPNKKHLDNLALACAA